MLVQKLNILNGPDQTYKVWSGTFGILASVSAFCGLIALEYLISYFWRRKKTLTLFVRYLDNNVIFLRKSTDGTVLKLILEEF